MIHAFVKVLRQFARSPRSFAAGGDSRLCAARFANGLEHDGLAVCVETPSGACHWLDVDDASRAERLEVVQFERYTDAVCNRQQMHHRIGRRCRRWQPAS